METKYLWRNISCDVYFCLQNGVIFSFSIGILPRFCLHSHVCGFLTKADLNSKLNPRYVIDTERTRVWGRTGSFCLARCSFCSVRWSHWFIILQSSAVETVNGVLICGDLTTVKWTNWTGKTKVWKTIRWITLHCFASLRFGQMHKEWRCLHLIEPSDARSFYCLFFLLMTILS